MYRGNLENCIAAPHEITVVRHPHLTSSNAIHKETPVLVPECSRINNVTATFEVPAALFLWHTAKLNQSTKSYVYYHLSPPSASCSNMKISAIRWRGKVLSIFFPWNSFTVINSKLKFLIGMTETVSWQIQAKKINKLGSYLMCRVKSWLYAQFMLHFLCY